ncbi:MAG: hypothetical protein FWF56_00650 [Firmicutes bacterium]|nr:hypothetical protein [Bacillota bacterium]MCL1953831.1 hypothetical protein [Bacillota bacterium]
MKNSTLLGLGIGMVVGAYLVDTFQPAQDLVDNCKRKIKSNASQLSKYSKNKIQEVIE